MSYSHQSGFNCKDKPFASRDSSDDHDDDDDLTEVEKNNLKKAYRKRNASRKNKANTLDVWPCN